MTARRETPRRLVLRALTALAIAVLSTGCGGNGKRPGRELDLRVVGTSSSLSSPHCAFFLRSRLAGGGSMTYCLERFRGAPGPNATVHDSGRMRFQLGRGIVAARVRVVMRFAGDGTHARQALNGRIVGGTGDFAGARGTITGGGLAVEDPPGHIASQALRYRLALARR
jgi:hypothetical protein